MAKGKFSIYYVILDYAKSHSDAENTLSAEEVFEWMLENHREGLEENHQGRPKRSSWPWERFVKHLRTYSIPGYLKKGVRRGILQVTDDQPKRFFYAAGGGAPAPAKSTSPAGKPVSEHQLYPKLDEFLDIMKISSKRINESVGSNRRGPGGNKWLYPDVVGIEDLSKPWETPIKDCVKQYGGDKKVKLWSFEVKRAIERSNVRKYFFQAVSNSSWANYGYLVAESLSQDAEDELRILSALHGIGFIRLDDSHAKKGVVIIPARERVEVDWNTANRIAGENPDFADYIEEVTYFLQTGKLRL